MPKDMLKSYLKFLSRRNAASEMLTKHIFGGHQK